MSDPRSDHPSDLLSAYLDDELPIEERDRVDHHLAECDACRNELDALHIVATAVAAEGTPPEPEDLVARIGARIDRDQVVPIRPRRRWVAPASIAATLAAVGLLVAFQWRQGTWAPGRAPMPSTEPMGDSRAPLPSGPASETREGLVSTRPPPAPLRARVEEVESKAKTEELARFSPTPGFALAPAAERTSELDRQIVSTAPGPVASSKDFSRANDEAAPPQSADQAVLSSPPPGKSGGRADAALQKAVDRVSVPAAAGFASRAAATGCGDSWIDSGRLGEWKVDDSAAAVKELAALARDLGGRGNPRRWADGITYELDVPLARYDAVVGVLRAKGVTGLEAPSAPFEGAPCVRQRVRLAARGN